MLSQVTNQIARTEAEFNELSKQLKTLKASLSENRIKFNKFVMTYKRDISENLARHHFYDEVDDAGSFGLISAKLKICKNKQDYNEFKDYMQLEERLLKLIQDRKQLELIQNENKSLLHRIIWKIFTLSLQPSVVNEFEREDAYDEQFKAEKRIKEIKNQIDLLEQQITFEMNNLKNSNFWRNEKIITEACEKGTKELISSFGFHSIYTYIDETLNWFDFLLLTSKIIDEIEEEISEDKIDNELIGQIRQLEEQLESKTAESTSKSRIPLVYLSNEWKEEMKLPPQIAQNITDEEINSVLMNLSSLVYKTIHVSKVTKFVDEMKLMLELLRKIELNNQTNSSFWRQADEYKKEIEEMESKQKNLMFENQEIDKESKKMTQEANEIIDQLKSIEEEFKNLITNN